MIVLHVSSDRVLIQTEATVTINMAFTDSFSLEMFLLHSDQACNTDKKHFCGMVLRTKMSKNYGGTNDFIWDILLFCLFLKYI